MSEAKPAEFKVPGEYRYDGDGNTYCNILPSDNLDHIKNNFELRDDDVMVITYPKSGTTWFQEMVWLIMNQADVETARKVNQDDRVPFLEIAGNPEAGTPNKIEIIETTESPRILKSHLAHSFFSEELKKKKTKVVFGVRNVKDSIVSYYHFYRMCAGFGNFTGTFNEFFELVREERIVYGDWFDHTLGYWNHKSEFNFYLLKYEDAKRDLKLTLKKLAEFLGKSMTDAQFETIAQHVSFDKMKNNVSVNKTSGTVTMMNHKISPFMRKGQVGDWRNYFTDEQNEYIDHLYKQRIIPTGLDVDFDL